MSRDICTSQEIFKQFDHLKTMIFVHVAFHQPIRIVPQSHEVFHRNNMIL